MAEQNLTENLADIVKALRSPLVAQRLQELAASRLAGTKVSEELLHLREALGEEVFDLLDDVIRLSPEELQAKLQVGNVPTEDVVKLLQWNSDYRFLIASFIGALRLLTGRKNVWDRIEYQLMKVDEDKFRVRLQLHDSEGLMFESTDTIFSLLRLSYFLINTFSEVCDVVATDESEIVKERYRSVLNDTLKAVSTALENLQSGSQAEPAG